MKKKHLVKCCFCCISVFRSVIESINVLLWFKIPFYKEIITIHMKPFYNLLLIGWLALYWIENFKEHFSTMIFFILLKHPQKRSFTDLLYCDRGSLTSNRPDYPPNKNVRFIDLWSIKDAVQPFHHFSVNVQPFIHDRAHDLGELGLLPSS